MLLHGRVSVQPRPKELQTARNAPRRYPKRTVRQVQGDHVASCRCVPTVCEMKANPLDDLLEKAGIKYEYENRGRHKAVVITGPLGTRRVFISATASDHRAVLNMFRDCKRTAREVGYDV